MVSRTTENSRETTVIMKNLSEDNAKRNSPKCLITAWQTLLKPRNSIWQALLWRPKTMSKKKKKACQWHFHREWLCPSNSASFEKRKELCFKYVDSGQMWPSGFCGTFYFPDLSLPTWAHGHLFLNLRLKRKITERFHNCPVSSRSGS